MLDARWHPIHNFSSLAHRNFLPFLLDILKENFFLGSLWCSPSNSQIQDVPLMFNWVHIWWLTWPAVSVCHFLHVKLVSFLLNHRGHRLPWKHVTSCSHVRWQRLVEEPPWVFACIWQNLCYLHIPQARTFHHAKLHPKALKKTHHAQLLATIHSSKILQQVISTPEYYHCT